MESRNWLRSFHSCPVIVLVHLFYFLFSTCLNAQNAKIEKVDMLVAGGTGVTRNAEPPVIEGGAGGIKGDAIVAVGCRAKLETKNAPPPTTNTQGKLVPPGFT